MPGEIRAVTGRTKKFEQSTLRFTLLATQIDSMARGLVLLEPHEQISELIDTAITFVSGTSGELVLLNVSEENDDAERNERMQALTDKESAYRPGVDGSEQFAEDIGEKYIGNQVPYHATGGFGEPAGRVAATVEEYDCDHVFLLGRRRSPTGKALFGDKTQAVLLESDVPVMVIMRE